MDRGMGERGSGKWVLPKALVVYSQIIHHRSCHSERSRGIWPHRGNTALPPADLSAPPRRAAALLAKSARHDRTRLAAFTLIELLVVIAIIAMLLAILLPTLSRVRKQAKGAACQVNLRQWGTTLALYLEDNEGRFPRTDHSAVWILTGRGLAMGRGPIAGSGPDANKPTQYHPVRTKGMLCPLATKPAEGTGGYGVSERPEDVTLSVRVTYGATFRAWVLTEPGPPLSISYGLNRWLFDRPVEFVPFAPPPPSYRDIYCERHAPSVPLLLDSAAPAAAPATESAPPPYEDARIYSSTLGPIAQSGMYPFCMNRHNGYVNGLFLDWSVRKIGLKELWTLKWHKGFNTANVWTKAGGVTSDAWPAWMRTFKEY